MTTHTTKRIESMTDQDLRNLITYGGNFAHTPEQIERTERHQRLALDELARREAGSSEIGRYRCMFNITDGIPCHFAASHRLPSGSLACEVCAARNGGGVELT